MATIKRLGIPLLFKTSLICMNERWLNKKNRAKRKRTHPIAAPKMGFSATHLVNSQWNPRHHCR